MNTLFSSNIDTHTLGHIMYWTWRDLFVRLHDCLREGRRYPLDQRIPSREAARHLGDMQLNPQTDTGSNLSHKGGNRILTSGCVA